MEFNGSPCGRRTRLEKQKTAFIVQNCQNLAARGTHFWSRPKKQILSRFCTFLAIGHLGPSAGFDAR